MKETARRKVRRLAFRAIYAASYAARRMDVNVTFARLSLVLIPLCGGALRAPAQERLIPAYRLRLLGVYDERSGDPIEGVKVSDMTSGASSLTSTTGTVTLVFLPDGSSLVRIQKLGYEPQTLPVAISPADTEPLTLIMRPLVLQGATQLPTVVTTGVAPYISPALRGFQEREKSGMGYFIDEATLRKNDAHQLADVIRSHTAGANIGNGSHGASLLLQSPRCMGSGGPPQVYLDGVPLASDPPPPTSRQRNGITPFDLLQFSVSQLAAVEWYPGGSETPTEFNATSLRCGVLLLWTRER